MKMNLSAGRILEIGNVYDIGVVAISSLSGHVATYRYLETYLQVSRLHYMHGCAPLLVIAYQVYILWVYFQV